MTEKKNEYLQEDMIVMVLCNGCSAGKERLAGSGMSCEDADKAGAMDGECKNGCFGLGSCIDSCKEGAMSLVDGKIVIDPDKCNGCMDCLEACPRHLIKEVPREATNFILCSNELEEDDVREICINGCLGCEDCAKACPKDAITIVNNHAVIDYSKCEGCVTCTVTCKRKIIVDTFHDLAKEKNEVAFVHCRGGEKTNKSFQEKYQTCQEAKDNLMKQVQAGNIPTDQCFFACRGLGDCKAVCRYDAISIVNGVAYVDPDLCVGCKECTFHCPMEIIEVGPYKGRKHVACSSQAPEEDVRKVCDVGCIGCGDCERNCPNDAIHVVDGKAVVDSDKCLNCGVCTYMCSRGCIAEKVVNEYTYLQNEALEAREGVEEDD
ncbi:MAG: 4Fe-4S binding protein [Clostridia bacterium]|nr:4Fe-4S binding protein [Clostridia bacterium]